VGGGKGGQVQVLIVEDDPVLQRGLGQVLAASGHQAVIAADGRHADLLLGTESFDLVVLDLGLPELDGISVLARMRRRSVGTPVLVLSARNRAEDRVRGLDTGADDYLSKPFDLAEFEARVRALLRRGTALQPRIGRLAWVAQDRQFWCGDAPLAFTPHELSLLELLAERPGRIVAKTVLAQRLADQGSSGGDNMVEVYVHRLRRKLVQAGVEIRTVRGMGYLLVEQPPDA
jgi:DNA-binding response OmpR family regulator